MSSVLLLVDRLSLTLEQFSYHHSRLAYHCMTNRYTTSYRSYNLHSRRYQLRRRVSLLHAEYQNGCKIPNDHRLRSYYHHIRRIPLSISGSHPASRSGYW